MCFGQRKNKFNRLNTLVGETALMKNLRFLGLRFDNFGNFKPQLEQISKARENLYGIKNIKRLGQKQIREVLGVKLKDKLSQKNLCMDLTHKILALNTTNRILINKKPQYLYEITASHFKYENGTSFYISGLPSASENYNSKFEMHN